MGESPFAITVQAVGTLMVAALLWLLTRLIPGQFLRYWSLAWVCLTWALFSLRMTKTNVLAGDLRPIGFAVYMLGEYLFGFLLWAGFRDYARSTPLIRADARHFLVLMPIALLLPWFVPPEVLLPIHTAIMAVFFAAAFVATLGIRTPRRPVALTIVRVMLAGLAIIFFHYGPLLIWSYGYERLNLNYLRLSPIDDVLYEALIELGLAFGMVVLATERGQEALAETNRQLAETSRRDALTGLYNRRAFDELLAESRGQALRGALAAIDVNDLKAINDRHLHAAGDAVLQLVARALVARFRVTDPVYRLGGDEFVVMMPGGSEADLAARMADIDDALMNLRVPGIAEPIDIRIAWGVVPYDNGDHLAAAHKQADAAMYVCKSRRKFTIPATV